LGLIPLLDIAGVVVVVVVVSSFSCLVPFIWGQVDDDDDRFKKTVLFIVNNLISDKNSNQYGWFLTPFLARVV